VRESTSNHTNGITVLWCRVEVKQTEERQLLCSKCDHDIAMFIGPPSSHTRVCQCYRSGGSGAAERQLTRSARATVETRSDFVIQFLLFKPTTFDIIDLIPSTTVALMRFLGMSGTQKIGPLPGVTETSDSPGYRSITIYATDPLPFMILGADPWESHIYGHGYGDYQHVM
jgi:hypothetical protein